MKKIAVILITALLVLSLPACKQKTINPGGTSSSEETGMNTSTEASNAGGESSGSESYEYKSFESMEAFIKYMKKTDFNKDRFFSDPDGPYDGNQYERFYMFRAEKCYYIPTVAAEDIKLQEISISPGGLIKYSYYTIDNRKALDINIHTRKDQSLVDNSKSLLSIAKEHTAGYAPDVTWSTYPTSGKEMAISSINVIALKAGDYYATMYVRVEREVGTKFIEYDSSVKDYAEKVTLEKVALK